MKDTDSNRGTTGHLPLMDTHKQVPRNMVCTSVGSLCSNSMPKPNLFLKLKRPTSQKVTFRISLVYTFTKHTGAGGQQEGGDSERVSTEARKQGLLHAGQALPSSGCLKTRPDSLPSLGWVSPQTMQHLKVYTGTHICYHSGLPRQACKVAELPCLSVTLGTQNLKRTSNSSGSQRPERAARPRSRASTLTITSSLLPHHPPNQIWPAAYSCK